MAAKKRKPTARKTTTRKTAAKKAPAKKAKTATKKTAAKKTTRKAPVKKAAARKAAPAKKPAAKKVSPASIKVSDALTKGQLMKMLSDVTEVSKGDVQAVYDTMTHIMAASLSKRGPRSFTLPGIAKFVVIRKKARKAKKGINPFTGEEMMFKAKPAQDVLKARLLKGAKEMVA